MKTRNLFEIQCNFRLNISIHHFYSNKKRIVVIAVNHRFFHYSFYVSNNTCCGSKRNCSSKNAVEKMINADAVRISNEQKKNLKVRERCHLLYRPKRKETEKTPSRTINIFLDSYRKKESFGLLHTIYFTHIVGLICLCGVNETYANNSN